jgi:glycerate 2-kinase
MKIVIAPQALKGSLSALETGQAIAQGASSVYPAAEIVIIPVADGGEGTLQVLKEFTGGRLVEREVSDPLGRPVRASFLLYTASDLSTNAQTAQPQYTAMIEMAVAAGLPLMTPEERNPRITTTYGVGELIRAALDEGCTRFIIGIGGSATNDGGAGMLSALGARFLDHAGHALQPGGAALSNLACIGRENMDMRLRQSTFEVACDVNNPLCGPTGATVIYGPQKGATPEMVAELDQALAHYADIIQHDIGINVRDIPGSGAAGGLGAALQAFLQATLRPGAQIVIEAVHLEEQLLTADLVITAEGQLDNQTSYGKSVGAVATLAKKYGLPVLAIAGSLGDDYQAAYQLGIDGIAVLPSGPMSLAYAMEHAAQLVSDTTVRMLKIFKIGTQSSHQA